jgi:hypothetical protein
MRVMQAEGFGGLFRRVGEVWRRNFGYTSHYLLMMPISQDTPLLSIQDDVTVQQVTPDDITAVRELVEIYGVPASEEGILKRLRQPGELCFAGRVDGKIVTYGWFLHSGEVKEFGDTLLRLEPDEVYCHDVYTVPEQRGKKIYPAMKALISRRLAQRYGKTKIIGYVVLGNTASLYASKKLGELHIGWLNYVKVFKKKHWFVRRIRPREIEET